MHTLQLKIYFEVYCINIGLPLLKYFQIASQSIGVVTVVKETLTAICQISISKRDLIVSRDRFEFNTPSVVFFFCDSLFVPNMQNTTHVSVF